MKFEVQDASPTIATENVIFIVYALKDSPETLDKVKDVCANFSALIRSMRNRFARLLWRQRGVE